MTKRFFQWLCCVSNVIIQGNVPKHTYVILIFLFRPPDPRENPDIFAKQLFFLVSPNIFKTWFRDNNAMANPDEYENMK